MKPRDRARVTPIAILMVIGAIVSIQIGTALAVGLFDDVGIFGAVFLRTAIAAVILSLFWGSGLAMLRQHPLLTVAFGLSLTAVTTFLYLSIDRIPLGAAVTIEFMGPLGVAVASSRRPRDLLWVALAAAGVWMLTGGIDGSELDPLGVAFAFAAGLFWAAYILLGRRVGQRSIGGAGLAISTVVAALIAAPLGVGQAGADLLIPSVLAMGAVLAVLSAALPFSLEIEAMRRIPSGTFGVMMSLEPAIAALAGLAILAQSISPGEAVAILLVVIASTGAVRSASDGDGDGDGGGPAVQP